MPGIAHAWELTPKAAVKLQNELAAKVKITPLQGNIRLVAGIDCSYIKSRELIVTAALLMDARTMVVRDVSESVQPCTFPYVPGLLSFREAPAVIAAVQGLEQQPDLLLCDGQGLAHPRGMGLATHIGLWLDLPAIGVAKSRLCGEYRMPGKRRGCNTRLLFQSREIGRVVRTRTAVKPLFISIGHRVTLRDAVRWTLRCTRGYRLPEPTRLAHHEVTRVRKELLERD